MMLLLMFLLCGDLWDEWNGKRLRICSEKVAAETGGADGVELDARGVREYAVEEDGVAADARARVADGRGLRVDERGEQRAQLERLVAARDAEARDVVVQEAPPHHLGQRRQQHLHLLVLAHGNPSHCPFLPFVFISFPLCAFTHSRACVCRCRFVIDFFGCVVVSCCVVFLKDEKRRKS